MILHLILIYMHWKNAGELHINPKVMRHEHCNYKCFLFSVLCFPVFPRFPTVNMLYTFYNDKEQGFEGQEGAYLM